jgi:uncharacterized protein YbjT (DUF2867 family)
MKIALTGAGGKLGQAILPLALAEGHQVVAIDRQLPVLPEGSQATQSTCLTMKALSALFQAAMP